MGMRLHVATKYHVEYSDTEAFNWKQSEFAELLDAADIQHTCDTEYTTFEIPRQDMCRLVSTIRTSEDDRILHAIRQMEYPRMQVADILEQMLAEADTNDSYVHLRFL